MNLSFFLGVRVSTSPVAAIAGNAVREDIAGTAGIEVTGQIARLITGQVTEAGLPARHQRAPAMSAMGNAAFVQAPVQDSQAQPQPETADGPVTQAGTARAPGMDPVGAAESLVRREMALVKPDRGEGELLHVLSPFAYRPACAAGPAEKRSRKKSRLDFSAGCVTPALTEPAESRPVSSRCCHRAVWSCATSRRKARPVRSFPRGSGR